MPNLTTTSPLPVIVLKHGTLFPETVLPLRVVRSKSVRAVEHALKRDRLVVAISENTVTDQDDTQLRRLSHVGTIAKIERATGDGEEGYQLLLRGISRMNIDTILEQGDHLVAEGTHLEDVNDLDSATRQSLLITLKELSHAILKLVPGNTSEIEDRIDAIDDLNLLVQVCLAHVDLEFDQRQSFLSMNSLKQKTLSLLEHLQTRRNELQVKNEVNSKLNERLGKQQREAILREQMRTIQEELEESKTSEGGGKKTKKDYRKEIESAGMPEEVYKIATEELDRMESLGSQSPEVGVIRNYLDLLVALPWKAEGIQPEAIDLEAAKAILKKDHEGLEDVKKKILQSLAIAKLKKTTRGQLLLLVGPPGVGKTSLGQSIARAMNRKFTRVALGGVRDEADIRGHRRTYIGAMPGRIIQAIKRVGSKESVILLDEIDKVGRGAHGDPTAALLELLDPEQNSTFTDHYLDVPYDLSKIVFIATANTLETIPGPLLDRMDIIEVSGYSTPEKVHIALNHLLPKIREDLGMTEAQVTLDDEALMKTIHSYTREAGVRDLNRKLTSLFRSVTERVANASEPLPIAIRSNEVEEILGKERFLHDVVEKVAVPGVATGLAWTPMGGEILFIESNLMPGNGKLMLTGQLGDVMKESAQIALSLLRSNLSHLIPTAEFEKKDIHIHVPAGATPKDGPSAGVTMLSSLASAFLKQPIDSYLGMTGEITLRGAVLPVGGIKEKVIAAHRAGLKKIVLSKKNERDLKDVPEEVRRDLEFHTVEKVSELLSYVFGLPEVQNSIVGSHQPDGNQGATPAA
jgi:ATP-dependent Lon protease